MPLENSSKRILVIGREVGPIAKSLKEKIPKVFIGAVDILGNQETRFFSDWAFSVEKQTPDISILRPKHRNILDLLFELAKVMLEDLEFDLLIPLSPLHVKPNYIQQLSQEVNIAFPNLSSVKKTSSSFVFLTTISSDYPEIFPPTSFYTKTSDFSTKDFPIILIAESKIKIAYSEVSMASIPIHKDCFIFPVSQIHCAFFVAYLNFFQFIGLQTLSPPYQHTFFSDQLERNALIPFSTKTNFSNNEISSLCLSIIRQLKLKGLITIYFILVEDKFFPVSCTVLPDENFDVWENRVQTSLVPFLVSANTDLDPQLFASKFVHKIPIYAHSPIKVPIIPKEYASQRNIPGVISNPEYPLCTVTGSGSKLTKVQKQLKQKKDNLITILDTYP
ncbi:MAG: hypothetical protein ACFE9L_11230 [Candidatus Hodarchaeota archaeon]